MNALASLKVRIFLTCWIVFSVFFATNVVREHYPAFSLVERGDWVCDDYAGLHSDIFEHTDGHWYVSNNVLASALAAVPLALFDPVLDRVQAHSQAQLAAHPEPPDTTYDTRYPLRREMYRRVKLAGLDLRFGASTVITSVFLMAPLSALLVVLMFHLLRERGLRERKSVWLALLFAFGTPVFFRSAHLNHNMFLMEAVFGAFVLLWVRPGPSRQLAPGLSLRRRAAAGFLCGTALALDYAGLVPAAVLTGYLLCSRARTANWSTSLREALPFALAAVPPVLFLLGTQWAMFGDPFTPAQFVMSAANYTDQGLKGLGLPTLEIFTKNLISPGWGLFTYAPLLLLGFVPAWGYRRGELLFPAHERRWSALLIAAFLLFCAANWYSLMQFNTGVRYLLPIVPFAFLAAADHLARLPRRWLIAVSIPAVLHNLVLCMMREVNDTEKILRDLAVELGIGHTAVEGYWSAMLTETPIPMAYRRLLSEGLQLPWLTVLRQTSPGREALLGNPLLVPCLLALTAGLILTLWRAGSRRRAFVSQVLPSGTR